MTTPVEKFKLDFLFKKTLGTPAALGTSYSSAAEAAGSSKSKIIKNLVINQEIPSAAPSTDLSMVDISNTLIPSGNNSDTKQISTTYPYIAKYTLTLKAASTGFSYYYNDPAAGKNLLDSVIPFNFDPKGTYSYDVKLDGTTVPGSGTDSAGTKSWILDTDSGYLYFPNSDAGSSAITITFWRYEGTYGVGSSNGGSSSGAVTGDLSSNGNLFIAYDTSLNSRLVVGSDVTINNRLFTLGDSSMNGNVNIGKDLTINGRLNVQNYTNQNIINTTTTNYQLIVSEDLSLNGRLSVVGDASLNGNLYVAGTITAGNYAANSIPSSAIIGGGSVISNFGNLTVSHLSPFDYTIDSNLFILETAVASGQNGNLNSTQVVYSTVDCSFSGNLIVGGDFIQSNINSVFSTPSIYSASTTPTITNISANTHTTLLATTQIIASNNIGSNIYTLPNMNIPIGNIYIPKRSNISIRTINIPIGYDISMLVQNANIAYGNNTYSNVSNTFNASNTVVGANITIANFKLLHSIDSIKAYCNYTFNNLTIPMGLNIAGTLNYKTPSDSTNVRYINFGSSTNTTIAAAATNQQIVANVTVPPYYMGNAISVYTPIAANVNSATTANLVFNSTYPVQVIVGNIYANIYQNNGSATSNPWGNVTLSTTTLYGNFTVRNTSTSANILPGNIMIANVYLTTGNVTFVPDICNNPVVYTIKYYALTPSNINNSGMRAAITFNSPTITGFIGNIYLNGNTSTPNPNVSVSSNVNYTGGTAASVTYASTINTAVNVTNPAGVSANYVNEVSSVLANNYNSIQVNIPQLSVVNADNYSIVYDTLIAGTDYSNIVANSFSYAANTTLNNSYNANIFLGNIIITNANFTLNNYSSNIAIIGNVNITNLTTPGNLNALGHSGNINTFTLYSNPGFTTNNNTTTDIKLSTYGSTVALTAPNYRPLSGNLQLTKSTITIYNKLESIDLYDYNSNYVSSVTEPLFLGQFSQYQETNNYYEVGFANVITNENVYLNQYLGRVNMNEFSLPITSNDMSYCLKANISSSITVPYNTNIISYKNYSQYNALENIKGNLTTVISDETNITPNSYTYTITNPYTSGYLDVNVLRVNKDLTVTGRMNVQNYTYKNIINTTVNNYQLIVSEDLSLNGRLTVASDVTLNGSVIINDSINISNASFLGGGSPNTIVTGYNKQGFYAGWNHTSGHGEVDFVNCKGGGVGGYYFYSITTGSSLSSNTPICYIYGNGQISATSYNATSDYRIKSNVIALSDTSYSVDLLRPVTYMNKTLGKQDIGFIAHEVQEQIPFLVNGEKDSEEYQTLNYTGLIGLLTKEIQDLKKENKVLREKMENIEIRLSNM